MASGDEGSNKTVVTGGEESRKSRRGRSRSRDVMVDINGRLAKVELAIADGQDKFEEVERRLDEGEEFRGEVLATVNRVAADSEDRDKALEATFQSEISFPLLGKNWRGFLPNLPLQRVPLGETKDELALCYCYNIIKYHMGLHRQRLPILNDWRFQSLRHMVAQGIQRRLIISFGV